MSSVPPVAVHPHASMQNIVQVHAAKMDNGRFFLPFFSLDLLFFCIGMFIVHSSGVLASLFWGSILL